jgi:ribosome-interacting GTPase 1
MATTMDKIKDIEAEMAKTQKNKNTSFHLGTNTLPTSISTMDGHG